MLNVSIQIEGVEKVSRFLEAFPRETSKAVLRAVNRGGDTAGTHANRIVSRDVGISVSDVRKRIRRVKATGQTLTYELRASRARIPAIKLGARGPEPSRGKGSGVRWRGGHSAHAFIATVRGNYRGVFERRPGAAPRKRKPPTRPQLPIRQVYGPSVGARMDAHRREIVARGTVAFHNELDRLLDRILKGANEGFGGGDAG